MREQADLQLVELAQAGDTEAYGQLFERYQSKIYNFAYSILGHAEDARDVTQDAFVRVFEALPGKQDLDFSPYVYKTARNLAYDVARTRGRFIGDPGTYLDAQVDRALDADPEGANLFVEQQAKVRAAVTALPTDYRAVLTLREIDEMSYQEIADSLGMPRNTVGVMISRARLKLRGAFRMQYVDADKLAEECKDMLPKLSAYIDGELKLAEVASVEEHLDGCPLCRLAVDEMREATKSYRAFIPLIPPVALKTGVFSRLVRPEGSPGSGETGQAPNGEGQVAEGGESLGSEQVAAEGGGPAANGTGGQGGQGDGPAGDGLGGGGPDAQASRQAQSVKSLTLKKALKSPALWSLIGLGIIVLAVGGIGIATGWGVGGGQVTVVTPAEPAITAVAVSSVDGTVGAASTVASASSIQTGAVTADSVIDVKAPSTPARTSPSNGALVSSDHVTLRWKPVKDPSGVRYGIEVQRWIGGGEGWHAGANQTMGETHYHTDVPIRIRWRVWGIDGAGNRSSKSSWWIVVRAADEGSDRETPSAEPSATFILPYGLGDRVR